MSQAVEQTRKCRVCRCTQLEPCNPPCCWAEPDLCSTCATTAGILAEWHLSALRPNRTALWKEAERIGTE